MAEVGIECLAAGDRQEDGTKRSEPDPPVTGEKRKPVGGFECGKHARVLPDMGSAGSGKGDEPDKRDRTEKGCNACCAA
jgi:hypothetical protein